MDNEDVVIDLNPANQVAAATADATFDIADLEDMEQAEVQLKRNGQPIPLFVTFYGPEHPKRKRYALDKQRRIRKQLSKTGRMDFGDPAEDEAEENEQIAACVIAWRGFVFNGQTLVCNRENAMRLLADSKRAWLRKAMKEAFDDQDAFMRGSVIG